MQNKKQTSTGKIFIITAPSGCGKTTITNEVILQLQGHYSVERLVTYTTRFPRINETPGVDYHFVSEKTFSELRCSDFFIETTTYNGFHYGSPIEMVERVKLGHSTIIITDLPGVIRLKELIPQAVAIWLTVPNIRILYDRLIARNTENRFQIKKRLAIARHEIVEAARISSLFSYRLLNVSRRRTVQNLKRIICKEKCS